MSQAAQSTDSTARRVLPDAAPRQEPSADRLARCSISLFPLDAWHSFEEMTEVLRLAEDLGFGGVSLADHLITPIGPGAPRRPSRFWPDNIAFASALARETRSLRLMLSAVVIPYRHPIQAAKSVATLDWLSGGRVDVVAGVGWMAEEFAALGIPMAERGARTDEYLRAMLELWTSESTRFEGRFVRFGDLTFEPRCVQRPHAPIFVGGAGGRAFRRIADLGVGWGPMNATAADVRRGKERLDELCRVTGRSWNGRIFTRVDVEGGNDVIRTSHRSHDADDRVEESRDAIDMRTLLDDYGGLA